MELWTGIRPDCSPKNVCTQKFGFDYEETFRPAVSSESIRSVMALRAQHKLQLYQMDVSTAFLNGELTKEVFMTHPEECIEQGNKHRVCRLTTAYMV